MKTKNYTPSSLSLLLAWLIVAPATGALAATQYATNSFTWDNGTTPAWGSVSGGPYSSVWTSGNDAVFEGIVGTVTLASPTVHNLTFNATGYTLSGASTLTLVAPAPTITLGSGILATNGNNTAAVIGGTAGLTKSGAGTFVLNGSAVHPFTGGLTVNGGTLTLDYGNLASPVNLIDSGNPLTLATGGGLTLTGKGSGTTAQTNNGVTLSAGYSPVIISRNGSSGSATFVMGALTRSTGSVLDFQPATAWTTTASTNEIVKTTGINGAGLPSAGTSNYFGAWGVWGTGTATRYSMINSSGQFIAGPAGVALTTTTAANMTSPTTVYTTAAPGYALAGNLTGYALLGNAAATITNGANTLTLNGILQINSGALTISGATGAGGIVVGAENDFVAIANSGTINLNAPIANKPANSSSVTLGGSGTLVLGAQHTYTGGTTLIGGGGVIVPSVSSTGGSVGNPTTGPFGGGTTPLNLAGGSIRSTTGSAQTIANTVTISADTTFPGATTEKALTFTGPVTLLNGTRALTSNSGTNTAGTAVIFSGAIGDGGNGYGITKLGPGNIFLTGANTYTGPTTISAGTLQIGTNSTSGSLSTSSSITDNATLAFNHSDDIVQGTHFGNLIAGTGTISKSGAGKLVLNQANTISNAANVLTLNAGTLVLSNSAALGSAPSGPGSQNINFPNATTTLEFATDSSVNAYNFQLGSGGTFTWVLNRATPGPAVTQSLGQPNLGGATLIAVAGANVLSGTPVISFPSINLGAGSAQTSTLYPSNVDFSIGPISIVSSSFPKTLRLDGLTVGNVINGPISNGLNTVILIKTNASTWTLNGANTYTGTTTISGGTLTLGAAATLSGTPTISVAAGALFDVSAGGFTVNSGQVLAGSGSVNGLVTVASGGKLVPGSSVGTLTNTALTLGSGATVDFEFADASGTSNDTVNVTSSGGLTLNGGFLNLYLVGGTTPFTTNGTYNLFQYSGAIGGTGISALSVANAQVGKTYTFSADGTYVKLTIGDAPTPAYWNVDASGSWGDSAKWLPTVVPDAASALVNFSSTNGNDITATRSVTLDGTRTLGVLAFSNSVAGFTLDAGSGGSLTFNNGSGSASIQDVAGNHAVNVGVSLPGSGANITVGTNSTLSFNGAVANSGNVSVSGPGTLVLGADNASYSGNTTVASGGTLQVGGGAAAGSLGSTTVANSGALVFNRSDAALVAANTINGTGAVTNNGTGTVTLSGTSSYSGPTAINSGTLAVSGGAAIGDSSTVVLANAAGATLRLDGNESIGSLAGGGVSGGTVNLQANTLTLGGTASSDYAGTITGSGTVNKSGSGTATLSGANNYSGGTTNIGGILVANNNAALGAGPVTIGPGATRLVVADGMVVSNNILINGGGATGRGVIENSGAGNATLSNGVITISGALAGGGYFASTGGGTLTIADPIIAPTNTPSSRVGTVIFSGGGSYTNFTVNQGITRLGANNGLCTSATVDVAPSAAGFLDLAGFNQTLVGVKRTAGFVATITNSATASDSTLTLTGTSTYPGLINDAGVAGSRVALVVDGGNFTVSGANTFSGAATIQNAGVVNTTAGSGLGTNNTVTISANSTLSLAAAALTLSEGLAGSGTVNVFLGTGTSSTLLNKDNSGFTGTLNVGTNAPAVAGSGKVQLLGALGSGATVNVFTNATVYLTGSTVTQTCALVLSGGDTGESIGQLRVDSGATWSGPVTLAGDITGTGDGTIGANSGTGFISGNLGESGGARALLKVGNGTVVLSGSNTYSGLTTVGGNGYLGVASTNALGSTAAGTVVNNPAAVWLADGVVVSGETITINWYGGNTRGALQAAMNATNEWAGPVLLGSSGTTTYDTRVGAQTNGSLKISGNISDGGGTNFNITADANNGRVIVSGTGNNYSGWTQIVRGILQLGANNALPLTTVFDVHPAPGVTDASVFDLAGFNQELAGLRRGNVGGPTMVTNSAVALSTLTVNNSTAAFTYDSTIAGFLALVKDGANTLTLSGTNTYTGNTVVKNGPLLVSGSVAGPGAVQVKTNATLGGSGTIGGAVSVEAGGTLAPGVGGIGTLAITTNLTLALGSLTQVELDAATGASDLVTGLTNITYGGTLVVSNVSLTAVTNGQSFTLFSSLASTGNFTSLATNGLSGGLVWSFNPTNGVLTAISGAPPTLSFTNLGGGSLQFSWTGSGILQSQTNTLGTGLNTNWGDYPGGGASPVPVTIDPANESVFFRVKQ